MVGGAGPPREDRRRCGLEIGYWIRASQVRARPRARDGRGALTIVAFRVCGIDRIEIRIDPANEASQRVPRALGFAEEATLRRRLPSSPGQAARDAVVFTLFADELDGSPVGPEPRWRRTTLSVAASCSDATPRPREILETSPNRRTSERWPSSSRSLPRAPVHVACKPLAVRVGNHRVLTTLPDGHGNGDLVE